MRPASGWSQHEREVVHKHRQEFAERTRKRRRFPLTPTIGHAQLVLPALQGGEACAVPAFIFFLGVDDQMLSVCAHVQVRKALLVQDVLGHDGLREQVRGSHLILLSGMLERSGVLIPLSRVGGLQGH